MRPDVAMQLRSMIRSMTEAVLPELSDAPAARAQAEIVIGSLEMLEQQLDHLRPFAAADVVAQVELCRSLVRIVPQHCGEDLERSCSAAVAAVDDASVRLSELDEHAALLRRHACDVVVAAYEDGPEPAGRVLGLVLDHAGRCTDRERAWVQRAGFDVFDNEIVTLADAARA